MSQADKYIGEATQLNDKAESQPAELSFFGRAASSVDSVFGKHFYKLGYFVGSRPWTTIGLTMLFCLLCVAGMSQLNSETRSDKLWRVQDTDASKDEKAYNSYFPPLTRMNNIMMEAKSGSALDKSVLTDAMALHLEVESVVSGDDTLRTLCISRPTPAHPCLVNSVLSLWHFDAAKLAADADPLATINKAGKSKDNWQRMLGGAVFDSSGNVVSAKVLLSSYFLQSRRELVGGRYEDKRGDDWEKAFLEKLKCDTPKCNDDDVCTCDYSSDSFTIYVMAQRSWRDVFGEVIRGDIGLINAAFFIMIIYVTLNLGGLCHKINQRALLALGCLVSIVIAGAAGYGLAMWFQIMYTPVMSIMPFVLIGIGVDDSFVIMNALDGTDSSLPTPERVALALSHAGVSIFMTSLTDFVAFAISMTSALPALSAFCGYAALSIIMLFVLQVTIFTAFATFDTRRTNANRIDCCPCLTPGCPCCPPVPKDEAIMEDGRDRNQLCCRPNAHQGGRVGAFMEKKIGPNLAKLPVAAGVVFVAVVFGSICAWQAAELPVEDATPKFVPDDSYVHTTVQKQDYYFGVLGTTIDVVTESGDYFGAQAALTDIGARLDKISDVRPSSSDSFQSWAASYQTALKGRPASVGATVAADANGYATDKVQYYAGLKAWLAGQGSRFAKDIIWNDEKDAQKGIRAARIKAELVPFTKVVNGKVLTDDKRAVQVMDDVRDAVSSWTDMPGGKAFAYSFRFLSWESFRIIRREIFMSLGLCLLAVLIIVGVIVAHPATAGLIFVSVLLTIVDILGCMNMWGLAIDSVTVVQLVISVGLSVDYAAHIGHCFMTKAGSRGERVIATLGDVGAAVLNGGISTFLATMLLALSKSYVFRVLFQTFFLTVVFGLVHGMIVLPAVLALCGPEGYAGRAHASAKVAPLPQESEVVQIGKLADGEANMPEQQEKSEVEQFKVEQ